MTRASIPEIPARRNHPPGRASAQSRSIVRGGERAEAGRDDAAVDVDEGAVPTEFEHAALERLSSAPDAYGITDSDLGEPGEVARRRVEPWSGRRYRASACRRADSREDAVANPHVFFLFGAEDDEPIRGAAGAPIDLDPRPGSLAARGPAERDPRLFDAGRAGRRARTQGRQVESAVLGHAR